MMNLCRSLRHLHQGLALMAAMVVFVLVHAAPSDLLKTIVGASGGLSEEPQAKL